MTNEELARNTADEIGNSALGDKEQWTKLILSALITAYRQLQKEAENPYFRVNTDGSVEKMNCSGCRELLAVLTTDEIDRSTLVKTLNSARKIILSLEPELYFEITEELCAWAEKLEEHKGETQ